MSKNDNTMAIIALGGLGLYLFKDRLKESLGGVSTATKGIGEGVSDVFTSAGDVAGVLSAELSKAIQLPSKFVEKSSTIIERVIETKKEKAKTKRLRAETEKIRAGADRETLILDIPRAVTEGSLRAGKVKQAQASLAVADLRRSTKEKVGLLPPAQISLGSAISSSIRSEKKSKKNIFDVVKKKTFSGMTSIFNKLRGN